MRLLSLFYKINLEMYTNLYFTFIFQPKSYPRYGEYNVYSTFQSHEPEFDYLKSLDIDEKINQIKWLKRRNQAHFLLSTNGMYSISKGLSFII